MRFESGAPTGGELVRARGERICNALDYSKASLFH